MNPMEAFQHAVTEIGGAFPVELSAYLDEKHGIKIDPHLSRYSRLPWKIWIERTRFARR
jgi:hypothetical protein